jgi:septal ring factor EnvC (AmiA/AmiB activator)
MKLNSFLVGITLLLTLLCVVLYIEVKNKDLNSNALRTSYEIIEQQNRILYKELQKSYRKIDSINNEKIKIEEQVIHIKDGIAHKEQELKDIKGMYHKLTNDSLRKSIIKAYEMDSVSHISK